MVRPHDVPPPSWFLPHLEAALRDIEQVAATMPLDTPVPGCPGWDLRQLVQHAGDVHRWARGAIVEKHPDTPEVAGPADQAALVRWYREGADALLDTLRRVDPDEECWGFGRHPRTAAFWFRRQAHENAVHAWDAWQAAGRECPFERALALDGVDEVVTIFFPRQVRLRRIAPLAASLALEPADGDGRRWVLAGDGTGDDSRGDAPAVATVAGPADALLLLAWGRVGLDDPRLAVAGDRAAAQSVIETALTP